MKRRSFLAGLGAAPFLRNMEINIDPEPAIEADDELPNNPMPEPWPSISASPSAGPDEHVRDI